MWGRSQPHYLSPGFAPALHTHLLSGLDNVISFPLEGKEVLQIYSHKLEIYI